MTICSKCGAFISYDNWSGTAQPLCNSCFGGPIPMPDIQFVPNQPAITLRDFFAGMALMGLIAHGWMEADKNADRAWEAADAMLVAREGGET